MESAALDPPPPHLKLKKRLEVPPKTAATLAMISAAVPDPLIWAWANCSIPLVSVYTSCRAFWLTCACAESVIPPAAAANKITP
ncbi:MAG: hypothetical protein ACR2QC_02940, partial [Gammaproteobacteria bacterium]